MFPEFCRFFSLVLTGRLRQALGSDELRFFLLAVALSSAIVFFNVLPLYESAGHALRDTLFQVSSVVSTTGFSTADFALWPTVSQFVLVLLMFLGGCAGSTAGGLKVSRVMLLFKSCTIEVKKMLRPPLPPPALPSPGGEGGQAGRQGGG